MGKTQTWAPSSPRSLTRARCLPSGDHAGALWEPGPGVRSRESPVARSRRRTVLLILFSSRSARVVT